MAKEKTKPIESTQQLEEPVHELVLYNDDINDFDYVIESLIDVCNHDPVQAEQCTLIAHLKGKCTVLSGSREELEPPYKGLTDRKLTVEIM
ncbi:MAG: hypothetical protein Kow00127_03930 [Bacteroidales bacterium]